MTDRYSSYANLKFDRPAEHVAAMARLVLTLGSGSSVSTQLPVDAEEGATIRRFLPTLAARHGLVATIDDDDRSVTVTFERAAR